MSIPILYEDDDVVVINKPPGVVVNRAQSVKGLTVQDWAEEKLGITPSTTPPVNPDDFVSRAGIVHRIDKETSGILLIAKNASAFAELQRQFKEHVIKKTYLAIVHGKLVPSVGSVNAPVGRLPWNRERFGIVPGGKESVTDYKTLGDSFTKEGEVLTLVELYPQTGRTHQIRVHMKHINHALLGDYLYAGRKTSRDDRVWAPRVMLHAANVVFLHPVTGQSVAIDAPMPDDMMKICQTS